MHHNRFSAFLALALTVCLLGALLAGCSEKPAKDSSPAETGESASQSAADSASAAPGDGTQTYATVEELLADDGVCEQYQSAAQTIWGTSDTETDINIYAQDNRVVFSYVVWYSSDGLDLATMRANFAQSMSNWVLVCNTISSGIARVVETPGAGLLVEILTSDGVQLFSGDYAEAA